MANNRGKDYPYYFVELSNYYCFVTFVKKDGTIRRMLATRNLMSLGSIQPEKSSMYIKALGGHDKRCSIDNGTIAALDVMIGEARSFRIERILDFVPYHDVVQNDSDLLNVMTEFERYTQRSIEEFGNTLDIGTL